LPAFRFNKAFSITQDVKAFLSSASGITRGAITGIERSEDHAENQKNTRRRTPEQRMDPAIRRRLEEYFEPHNQRLYEHLGVDFGW
jgi:hypothetical protein